MGYGATDSDDRSHSPDEYNSSIDLSDDDVAIIPKGALDPVYEAKARLLNRAVSHPSCATSLRLLRNLDFPTGFLPCKSKTSRPTL